MDTAAKIFLKEELLKMKIILSAFISPQHHLGGKRELAVGAAGKGVMHLNSVQQSLDSMISSNSPLMLGEALGETKTFEAVPPDTSTLVGFGVVLILSVVASFVWANSVVPVSRTKLALSKRDGEVKEYLEELKEGSFSAMELESDSDENLKKVEIRPNVGDGRDVERWLFSDWLNDNKSAGGGRKKEPALPILKKAKWNSGDNPVLVTAGIMMIGIVIASFTERVM